ncbi:uncharacterized protein AMSG_02470 [Thecamonas trahens ATCC 50062]|uniref:Uncharacterized protein n=1 Tax=Thecamonas trahens ATCC 50062 TaxID=461836 RepID=A0A0L0D817_THETB|nr:hypothetical protein AMSG_02470 [Thecamonas trahens ATCC 50062]KNC47453.1 hypothetical protein AMSG_02470 [Thecamonas trahens ATCC 50062]|eukprot:XP_013759389.1 hypothetical protein AMSG_02470 [Thecamonas trahens ATCC 50062]
MAAHAAVAIPFAATGLLLTTVRILIDSAEDSGSAAPTIALAGWLLFTGLAWPLPMAVAGGLQALLLIAHAISLMVAPSTQGSMTTLCEALFVALTIPPVVHATHKMRRIRRAAIERRVLDGLVRALQDRAARDGLPGRLRERVLAYTLPHWLRSVDAVASLEGASSTPMSVTFDSALVVVVNLAVAHDGSSRTTVPTLSATRAIRASFTATALDEVLAPLGVHSVQFVRQGATYVAVADMGALSPDAQGAFVERVLQAIVGVFPPRAASIAKATTMAAKHLASWRARPAVALGMGPLMLAAMPESLGFAVVSLGQVYGETLAVALASPQATVALAHPPWLARPALARIAASARVDLVPFSDLAAAAAHEPASRLLSLTSVPVASETPAPAASAQLSGPGTASYYGFAPAQAPALASEYTDDDYEYYYDYSGEEQEESTTAIEMLDSEAGDVYDVDMESWLATGDAAVLMGRLLADAQLAETLRVVKVRAEELESTGEFPYDHVGASARGKWVGNLLYKARWELALTFAVLNCAGFVLDFAFGDGAERLVITRTAVAFLAVLLAGQVVVFASPRAGPFLLVSALVAIGNVVLSLLAPTTEHILRLYLLHLYASLVYVILASSPEGPIVSIFISLVYVILAVATNRGSLGFDIETVFGLALAMLAAVVLYTHDNMKQAHLAARLDYNVLPRRLFALLQHMRELPPLLAQRLVMDEDATSGAMSVLDAAVSLPLSSKLELEPGASLPLPFRTISDAVVLATKLNIAFGDKAVDVVDPRYAACVYRAFHFLASKIVAAGGTIVSSDDPLMLVAIFAPHTLGAPTRWSARVSHVVDLAADLAAVGGELDCMLAKTARSLRRDRVTLSLDIGVTAQERTTQMRMAVVKSATHLHAVADGVALHLAELMHVAAKDQPLPRGAVRVSSLVEGVVSRAAYIIDNSLNGPFADLQRV